MKILGLNAFHADSSAALVIDGEVVAAAEEERFSRVKHWAGFPAKAIQWCLESRGLEISDLDAVALNQNSRANIVPKAVYSLTHAPSFKLILEKLFVRRSRSSVPDLLREAFPDSRFSGRFVMVEHHQAHLASAFYPSGFDRAWAVSVDGFGDFSSTSWAFCDGVDSELQPLGRVLFPHSLGVFYQACTQFLGFPNYGDEYKIMGLAPYGKPRFVAELEQLVLLKENGSFGLDLKFFRHHREKISFEWDDGSPVFDNLYSAYFDEVFSLATSEDGPTEDQIDFAHSVQVVYERAFFNLLNALHKKNPVTDLVVSGGCGMNSVANGKIRLETPFQNLYVQPAAGDAGGAIGAALTASKQVGASASAASSRMRHAYLGPSFSVEEVAQLLQENDAELSKFSVECVEETARLCSLTAQAIAEGKVVGWFHGAMEWGPRALGHRSILGDPRRADMKDILNAKIKRRESFRPFAPSVLREHVNDWFEQDADVPFMMQVFQIAADKRQLIPAVTHVDGSGRLQTVTEPDNGRYYDLIRAFHEITGVPMVLNTSFNENEPIVCTPAEALSCFLRTNMDVLVLEDYFLERV